jgi:RimJ/RimL family protein N-acetyltransferase
MYPCRSDVTLGIFARSAAVIESVDLATFEARHGEPLAASLLEHVRFAFLWPRLRPESAGAPAARLWSSGGGTACAVLYRGTLLLGDLDGAAIDAVVADALPGGANQIGGAEADVARARECCNQAGVAFSPPQPVRVMVLRQPPHPHATSGAARPAEARDVELVSGWLDAFQREALPDQGAMSPAENEAHCRRFIDTGKMVLWEDDGAPVAMAALVQDLPRVAAISLVYTPAERRGRGYAGAAVSLLSERIIASGRPACLFVDARNPISARCYTRVGYMAAGPLQASAYRVTEPAT